VQQQQKDEKVQNKFSSVLGHKENDEPVEE